MRVHRDHVVCTEDITAEDIAEHSDSELMVVSARYWNSAPHDGSGSSPDHNHNPDSGATLLPHWEPHCQTCCNCQRERIIRLGCFFKGRGSLSQRATQPYKSNFCLPVSTVHVLWTRLRVWYIQCYFHFYNETLFYVAAVLSSLGVFFFRVQNRYTGNVVGSVLVGTAKVPSLSTGVPLRRQSRFQQKT